MDILDVLRALSYAIIAVGSVVLAILYLQYYRIKRQTTFLARTMVAIMLTLAVVGLVGMLVIWCRDFELSSTITCEQHVLSAYTWSLFALAVAVLMSVGEYALVLVRHNRDMDADEAVTKAAVIPAPVVAPVVAPAPSVAPVPADLPAATAAVAYSAVDAAQATADVANEAVKVARAAATAGSAPAAEATANVAERSATVASLAGDVATLATDVASEISKITQEGKAAE